MPGRSFNSNAYRYGYQGSEKDNEIAGAGNSYTTFFRQLDPRLGRWFSCDPVFQPWQSPYTSMDNNPINLNDVMGNVASGGPGDEEDKMKKRDSEGNLTDVEKLVNLGSVIIVVDKVKTASTESVPKPAENVEESDPSLLDDISDYFEKKYDEYSRKMS